jgi:Bacterial conjugation TrbI-like protein
MGWRTTPPTGLQKPASPYQLMAGTVIAASMVSGLNSDLPGFVIAQVTENVYDTVSGRYLLIPQGARLVGKYDNVIAFAQERVLVVWQRIILPDGSSIVMTRVQEVGIQRRAPELALFLERLAQVVWERLDINRRDACFSFQHGHLLLVGLLHRPHPITRSLMLLQRS